MRITTLLAAIGVLGAAGIAAGAVTWDELLNGGGDAGALIATAQPIDGSGCLTSITGSTGGADLQDMYIINIFSPATLAVDAIGFDTQLFLFSSNPLGRGLLGNDDDPSGGLDAFLDNSASDLTGLTVTLQGVYYLVVSGTGAGNSGDPLGAGSLIFNQATATEQSGPDGPGGAVPLSGWSAGGTTGAYTITLQGVSHCCPGDIDGNGNVGVVNELAMLAVWGTCPGCAADLDCDGFVGTTDFLGLLAPWGPCPC